MMQCSDIAPLLSEYADGSRDPRTRRLVDQHVQLCPACKQRVEGAAQVAHQLRRLSLLPPGVASRAGRTRRQLEARAQPDRRRLEHYPFYVAALLAATLVLLTLMTVFYFGL